MSGVSSGVCFFCVSSSGEQTERKTKHVRVCKIHPKWRATQEGCVNMVTPPCKVHAACVWRALQGGVTQTRRKKKAEKQAAEENVRASV